MITQLRDYQLNGIDMLRQSIRSGHSRIIAQAATGAGKTKLAASIVLDALAKGKRVCFVVPYLTLISQTLASFEAEGLGIMTDMGVIQADHPYANYAAPVQICSKDTLSRRSDFPIADLVIVDEAHITSKFLDRWKIMRPATIFIGLTATPWQKGMAKVWDDLVVIATAADLIERGYLSDFRVYAPSRPDLKGVKTQMGDYNQKELAERTNTKELVASIVNTWMERGKGRPTICYAVNCAHAQMIQADFIRAGINAGYVDAHTDADDRKKLFTAFESGEVEVICNVGVLVAGFDSDVRCIILATPTKSEIKFVQCVGRGLRTAPGKDYCLILDHSSTHCELGFVTDIHYAELDDGKPKKQTSAEKKEKEPKACPTCTCLLFKGVCPGCGFAARKQSDVDHVGGELVEMTAKKSKKKVYTPQEKQEIWAMLRHYQIQKGYSKGWVYHTCQEMLGTAPATQTMPPITPNAAVMNFIRHKNIKRAKGSSRTTKNYSPGQKTASLA